MGLKGKATLRATASAAGMSLAEADRMSEALVKKGLLNLKSGEVMLTEEGRRRFSVVFIGGGFEVIHSGHLYTINEAKKLGDVLVAVVATDKTIKRRKGREPVASQGQRMNLLSALRQVDCAILGTEGDIYKTLERVRPDVVALGYDQYHLETDIMNEGKRRGMNPRVVRLDSPYTSVKTSRILKEL